MGKERVALQILPPTPAQLRREDMGMKIDDHFVILSEISTWVKESVDTR
jgi:hypothetical protein